MFGRAKQVAGAKTTRNKLVLHSIAGVMRGRALEGGFELAGVDYGFSYQPKSAKIVGRRLELTGNFTVIDKRRGALSKRTVERVRATVLSAQSGIGTAPPRTKLPANLPTDRPDLPVVESTGSLSFCGVLYLRLAPMDGRALGLTADLSKVQLNARLAPRNDVERALQAAYSSIVDALFAKEVDSDAANTASSDLNRQLSAN